MPRSYCTYINNIKYLETNWTEKEVRVFIRLVKKKVKLLEPMPTIGRKTSSRKGVHKTLIHKRIMLFYRFRPRLNQVELLSFWHTSRNPQANKFLP